MAEGHKEIQGRESRTNNVINFEAEREYRLLRKSRGYKEPPKHIKIITAFLNRYTPEPTPIDQEPLRIYEAPREKTAPAPVTHAEHLPLEPQNNDIVLASIRRKLRLAQKERLGDSRKWYEIAKANGWETNPDYPDDGFYVDRIFERAQKLGLDPLTLTPQERKEHAEIEAKYRVRPPTPEETEYWLLQYGGKRRNDVPPHALGEVISRILEMIGNGIKAITPPRKGKL